MDKKQGTSPGSTGGAGQVYKADTAPEARDARIDKDGQLH